MYWCLVVNAMTRVALRGGPVVEYRKVYSRAEGPNLYLDFLSVSLLPYTMRAFCMTSV